MTGLRHTLCRTWLNLEKQRGILGMTWRMKVQGVVIAVVVLAALAMAAGAYFIDADFSFLAW